MKCRNETYENRKFPIWCVVTSFQRKLSKVSHEWLDGWKPPSGFDLLASQKSGKSQVCHPEWSHCSWAVADGVLGSLRVWYHSPVYTYIIDPSRVILLLLSIIMFNLYLSLFRFRFMYLFYIHTSTRFVCGIHLRLPLHMFAVTQQWQRHTRTKVELVSSSANSELSMPETPRRFTWRHETPQRRTRWNSTAWQQGTKHKDTYPRICQ